MSNFDIKTLEGYIFAESKDEFLKKLLAGTDSYYYFNILH